MKKLLLLLILAVLLTVTALPTAAGNGPGNGPGNPEATPQPTPQGQGTLTTYRQSAPRGTFAIVSTITAIDETNKSITVTVLRGNNLAKPYINLDVIILTTAKTKFLYKTSLTTTTTKITFADLAVDDIVSVNGIVANDIWTASRVTEGASLNCLP